MRGKTRTLLLSLPVLAAGLAVSLQAPAHLDDKQPMQSYRQSWFALVGMNFGTLASMVKGDMPWNDEMAKTAASDLSALTQMDVSRAFPPGTEKGTTRAKPEIWEEFDDFKADLAELQEAVAALQVAADSGDKKAIAAAVGETGKTCKGCHDEFKSKDYLY
ncbi:cytochrome c [Mangrovimicrobium sediminis]|uniref:Cytochrome c n=1 Tax=Mangrovimicrobium sediminis TaxID=2562682 RepID=A0A4Z0M5F0_9GAMM|nr:cytochrome c [Haliea sp. SAOS-164]TGD74719.1 cytochrome c [Haliea sp. SAOS-164]